MNIDNQSTLPTPSDDDGKGAGVPGFVATHEELLVLAKYWTKKNLERDFTRFCNGERTPPQLPSDEAFASTRLALIEDALGSCRHAVPSVIHEVHQEFARQLPPGDDWEDFISVRGAEIMQARYDQSGADVPEPTDTPGDHPTPARLGPWMAGCHDAAGHHCQSMVAEVRCGEDVHNWNDWWFRLENGKKLRGHEIRSINGIERPAPRGETAPDVG